MSKKEFNISKCVAKNSNTYCFYGVHYENGYKIATDGRIMAVIKADYSDSFEGKTIDNKTGQEIADKFPNYKVVIPDEANCEVRECPDVEIVGAVKGMSGNRDKAYVYINFCDITISVKHADILYDFIRAFDGVEMLVPTKGKNKNNIIFRSDDNMLVIAMAQGCTFSVAKERVSYEPKTEPKTYMCDSNSNHVKLKVTYKQLKEVCPNVLTVGKSDILKNLTPMCTTWGQNGWNVLAYDFPGVIITSGDGANGIHIPGDLIKKYEAEVNKLRDENGAIVVDDYKALMDKFIVDVETWYISKINAKTEKKANDFTKEHIHVTGMRSA